MRSVTWYCRSESLHPSGSPSSKGMTVAEVNGFGEFWPSLNSGLRGSAGFCAGGGVACVPCAVAVAGTSTPRASTANSAAQRSVMCLFPTNGRGSLPQGAEGRGPGGLERGFAKIDRTLGGCQSGRALCAHAAPRSASLGDAHPIAEFEEGDEELP